MYSLGLLDDGEEKQMIQEHLARNCETCERQWRDALAVQALMLSQTPQVVPPVRLKRRVMASVGVQPSGSWTWLAALAASSMLVVALWFSLESRSLQTDLNVARQDLAEATTERDTLAQAFRFLEEPRTRQVNFGAPASAPPRGNVYVNPELGVLLIAANLPPLTAAQTYQMWLIPKDGSAPRPAGLFQSAASGAAVHTLPGELDLTTVDAVAVTVEPAGGSPGPTPPIVLAVPIA
jgi:hypothetical protein